jgi:hypothetical protein
MPIGLSQGNAQYTAINTAGTTTLNPGQSGTPGIGQQGSLPASFGALYGVSQVSAGTSFAFTVYDIVPNTPAQIAASGTGSQTSTLMNGTGTAGQVFAAGIQGEGIRYKGALVVVTAGTPGLVNVSWD